MWFCLAPLLVLAAPANKPAGQTMSIQVNDAATGDAIGQADVDADGEHALTDDFGQCSLTVAGRGQYFTIGVSKKGYVSMSVRWQSLSQNQKLPSQLTFAMTPGGVSIGGKIIDESGKPVAGAKVDLNGVGEHSEDGTPHNVLDGQAVTDGDGVWKASNAPGDLQAAWYRVTGAGIFDDRVYRNISDMVALRKGSAVMTVSHAGAVSGRLLDPAGKPVANAEIMAGDEGMGGVAHRAHSDAQGNFKLNNLAAGMTAFAVFADGFAPQIVTAKAPSTEPVEVHLTPGKVLRFHVVDKAGKGLNGVEISVDRWHNAVYVEHKLYTDASGNATWNGAPPDEVQMSFTKRHYGAVVSKDIEPSDQPITITLNPPTRANALVSDAATGKPVDKYSVEIGICWRNSDQIYWQPAGGWIGTITDSGDGHFTYSPRQDYPGYALRVSAAGYTPNQSRQFDTNAGDIALEFKMEKGVGIAGVLYDSQHHAVSGAKVYMVTPGRAFMLQTHGQVGQWMQQQAAITDASGHFDIAPEDQAFALIAITDEGIARLDAPALHPHPDPRFPMPADAPPMPTTRPANYDLQIQKWGSIQGKFLVGSKPAADAEVSLMIAPRGGGPSMPHVWYQYQTTTDGQGNFAFDHVPPGDLRIGRQIPIENARAMAENIPVHIKAGETDTVRIGGSGREVVGKFALPALVAKGDFIAWDARITREIKPPAVLDMPLLIRLGSDEAKKKWRAITNKTPEFQAYFAEQKKATEDGSIPGFGLWVAADGTFHADNVPAGKYELRARFYPPNVAQTQGWDEALAVVQKSITVDDGPSDKVVDLGTIEATPGNK